MKQILSTDFLISVIITTYNRPDALELVLSSLAAQTDKNFEVLIADDGSTAQTQELVQRIKKESQLKIKHVWQEDQGFRAAQIRNKAVSESCGDYLIFLDGDSVPLTTFIARHRKLRAKGYFVFGNRVLLNQEFTAEVLKNKLPIYAWPLKKWWQAKLHKKCNHLLPLIYLPLGVLRKLKSNSWRGVKTCNLGLSRNDFLAVNGLDESYQGWGYEDSDLVIRLLHYGIRRKQGRFAIPIIHLWHKENDRSNKDSNWQRLLETARSKKIRAEKGIIDN